MNHQDIANRFEALRKEEAEACRKIAERSDKERVNLRELCGGLGHIFVRLMGSRDVMTFSGMVECCVCKEWKHIPDRDSAIQRSTKG